MEIGTTRTMEWPTLVLLAATYLIWAAGTTIWPHSVLLSLTLTTLAITQFSSLQHEVLHGHPFQNRRWNEALVYPALGFFIPFRRFRDSHLQHHYDPALTDPYDDPESYYCDPVVWARLPKFFRKLLEWNNTLAGRMLFGPALGTVQFIAHDMQRIQQGDIQVRNAWLMHIGSLAVVVCWLTFVAMMPLWAYFVAVYLALSVLRIRTFLEHRAHDLGRARTVVVEDRGPLALLFLNNNFHVVHHMHPSVPWYRLPGLYAARKAHFLRRNEGYVYKNYAEIFRRYWMTAKEPVAHPAWPVKKTPIEPEN
ncbi:MAG: fatty acid desaturase [bacterium]